MTKTIFETMKIRKYCRRRRGREKIDLDSFFHVKTSSSTTVLCEWGVKRFDSWVKERQQRTAMCLQVFTKINFLFSLCLLLCKRLFQTCVWTNLKLFSYSFLLLDETRSLSLLNRSFSLTLYLFFSFFIILFLPWRQKDRREENRDIEQKSSKRSNG